MINVIIIEDEKPAQERLKELLKDAEDITIIDICTSGKNAAKKIDLLKPQLIFLDVQLTDMTGIDLLHLIDFKPLIIFTTAYDQYAVQAFNLNAIDYLQKPFSKDRLQEAIQKVRTNISQGNASNEDIIKLISQWKPQQNYLRRIPSKIGDKIYIITDDEIVYIASEDKLVFAYLEDRKYLINYTLEELLARLDPDKYFRIHRSTIVNLNYVESIEAWFAGGYKMKVKTKDSTELTISRSAGRLLREKLGW